VTTTTSADLLETIVAATRRIVDVRSAARPLDVLERGLPRNPDGLAFERALRTSPTPRVIAECKRRSPSRGILRRNYDPAEHARSYESAGAAAISVLTEPTFFDGSLEHLAAVREAVKVPILRKDFIVSRYQLVEAAVAGADAVLLIVGACEPRLLQSLLVDAHDLGLAALVEVHDVHEIERAVDAGAQIIGVNSRNLRTLDVDPSALDNAASRIPRYAAAVAESGVRSPADLARLGSLGYHAFLVGERLITEADPGAALEQLRSGGGE
jgi:indole-3-glycerol phosphate synthase